MRALHTVPLVESDAALRAALGRALSDPAVERWLGMPAAEAVQSRYDHNQAGTSVHAVLLRGTEPVGWAGWARYPQDPTAVETSTYLAPPVWGTGVNAAAKSLQYQVAALAGVRLLASVHADNARSAAALRRAFPHAPATATFEPARDRHATVFTLTAAPDPYRPWPPGELATLVAAVAAVPART